MGEIIFTSAMFVIFAVFRYGSAQIETGRSVDPVGAAFVPDMVILTGGILTVIVLVVQIRKYLAGKAESGGRLNAKTLILLGSLVAFLLALDTVGFPLCAILLFFVLTLLLGNKSYWRAGVTALVSSCVFVIVFGRILSVPLPRGDGVFRILSHWLF